MSEIGKEIAHFTILERIGAGGMGVVYLAHDNKLRRKVALKLLPPETAQDDKARARLLREARLASALNHPNICTIHEIGEAVGRDFIAMEFIEGKPLGALIPSAGLSPPELLDWAIPILAAVGHAHGHGVIHRDLKSSNVLITTDGRVKVLDFGLARRVRDVGEPDLTASSPTLTATGAIAGTPHYLAPEVLQGHGADECSDIWALGVLLYEMAAGHLPFKGDSLAELSGQILFATPPALPDAVPTGLAAVISRCLEKDPQGRYPSASEVMVALESEREFLAGPPRGAADRRWSRIGRPTLVAVLLIVATVVSFVALRSQQPSRRQPREIPLTSLPSDNPVLDAALSPDGRHLAFADTSGYYLLRVDTSELRSLTGTESLPRVAGGWGGDIEFAWFPDGREVLITTSAPVGGVMQDSLWVVSLLGGGCRLVRAGVTEAAVSPDGKTIAFLKRTGIHAEIWLMNADGTDARALVPRRIRSSPQFLAWSPSGERLAYLAGHQDSTAARRYRNVIETCDLSGAAFTEVFSAPWLGAGWGFQKRGICWLSDSRLVFYLPDSTRSQDHCDLWSVRTDPRSGQVKGEPTLITGWTGGYVSGLTASADGKRLACVKWRLQFDVHLAAVLDGGKRLGPSRRLTLDQHTDILQAWAPDSRAVLFLSTRRDPPRLFLQDIDQRIARQVVLGGPGEGWGCVTSDGVWVIYGLWSEGTADGSEFRRARLAGGDPEPLLTTMTAQTGFGCGSRPGSPCVMSVRKDSLRVFYVLDVATGDTRELARQPWRSTFAQSHWELSPDGSRVAEDVGDGALILDLSSARESVLAPPTGYPEASFVTWAAAGGLWWTVPAAEGGNSLLLYQDSSGHTYEAGAIDCGLTLLASPDGRYLAFDRQQLEANVSLLEGF